MITLTPYIMSFSVNFEPSTEYDVEYYKVHAVHSSELVDGTFVPSESNLISKGPDTTFLHKVEQPGEWCVRIAGVDTFGEDLLNYSPLYTVTVPVENPLDTEAPGVPIFVSLPAADETGIEDPTTNSGVFVKVAWNLAVIPPDFMQYVIAYKRAVDSAWVEQPVLSTNYKVSGVLAGDTYEFKVKAVDQWNNASAFSAVKTVVAKTDGVAPAPISSITALAAFKNIFVEWSVVVDADFKHYELQCATENTFAFPSIYTCGTNSFTYTGVAGTTYYFRVRAWDLSNNSSSWSSTATAASNLIGTTDLTNLLVDASKLADSAVTSTKIANLAVGTAAIANLAVTNGKIAALAVDSAKIADLAVTDAKIADATITSAKIHDLAADKITTGTLSATTSISIGDSKIKLDGATSRITVANTAGTVLDMVTLGKLGTNNYGISIKDKSGNQVLKIDEAGATIANLTAGTIDAAKVTINNLTASNIKTGTLDAEIVTIANLSADVIDGGTINASVSVNTPNVNIQDNTIIGVPTTSKSKGSIVGNADGDVYINTADGVNWSRLWHEKLDEDISFKLYTRYALSNWEGLLDPSNTTGGLMNWANCCEFSGSVLYLPARRPGSYNMRLYWTNGGMLAPFETTSTAGQGGYVDNPGTFGMYDVHDMCFSRGVGIIVGGGAGSARVILGKNYLSAFGATHFTIAGDPTDYIAACDCVQRQDGTYIYYLASYNGRVYKCVGTPSTGTSWVHVATLPVGNVYSVSGVSYKATVYGTIDEGAVLITTATGVYGSSDGGYTWTEVRFNLFGTSTAIQSGTKPALLYDASGVGTLRAYWLLSGSWGGYLIGDVFKIYSDSFFNSADHVDTAGDKEGGYTSIAVYQNVCAFLSKKTLTVANVIDSQVHFSVDYGETWNTASANFRFSNIPLLPGTAPKMIVHNSYPGFVCSGNGPLLAYSRSQALPIEPSGSVIKA